MSPATFELLRHPATLAVLGAAVGSFLNVVIHRLPRGLSIARPASHCPRCKHPVAPWDNVPVVSWFLLGGKCRHCRKAIPFRYPMVEAMTAAVAKEVTGSEVVRSAGGAEIDLTPPWPRLDLHRELMTRSGIDFLELRDIDSLANAMRGLDIHVEPNASWGRLLDKAISSVIEPNMIQPAFLVDYPVEMSPLAKRKPGADGIVERFEAFVAGSELANAFTELNDPVDQRARFEEQERLRREHGEDEVDRLDEDFLVAVEHGMQELPQTVGEDLLATDDGGV